MSFATKIKIKALADKKNWQWGGLERGREREKEIIIQKKRELQELLTGLRFFSRAVVFRQLGNGHGSYCTV